MSFSFFLMMKLSSVDGFFFFFLSFVFFGPHPGHVKIPSLGRAVAAGLHHTHRNSGSEWRLQPTPQLTAKPDA